MAIKIIPLTLGRIIEQGDGYVVKITGFEPKKFTDKDAAEKYLEKHAPKRYKAGLWANGKLKWKTFKHKKAAESHLFRNNIEVTDGTYRPISAEKAKATFTQYAESWRNKYLIPEDGLKASTRSVRQYCLDKHLIGRFGGYPLKAISPDQITDFRADLLKDGKSAGHVNKLLNLLNTIFDDAINDGYLKASPMPRKRRDKKDRGAKADREKARALTYEQAQEFLAETDGHADLKLVVMLGLLAGLRRGRNFCIGFCRHRLATRCNPRASESLLAVR